MKIGIEWRVRRMLFTTQLFYYTGMSSEKHINHFALILWGKMCKTIWKFRQNVIQFVCRTDGVRKYLSWSHSYWIPYRECIIHIYWQNDDRSLITFAGTKTTTIAKMLLIVRLELAALWAACKLSMKKWNGQWLASFTNTVKFGYRMISDAWNRNYAPCINFDYDKLLIKFILIFIVRLS